MLIWYKIFTGLDPYIPVTFNIPPGSKTLNIIIQPTPDGPGCDHPTVADPKLLLSDKNHNLGEGIFIDEESENNNNISEFQISVNPEKNITTLWSTIKIHE